MDDNTPVKEREVVVERSSNPIAWVVGGIVLLLILLFLFGGGFFGGNGTTETPSSGDVEINTPAPSTGQ